MFRSPRALARAMASATIRLAFSCLHRVSTFRKGSVALTIRKPCEAVVELAEDPVEVLMTFTTETAPPEQEAELVLGEK